MDFWALGVMLYQSLVGKPPFRGATEYLTFEQILGGDFEIPDDVSPEGRDLIAKFLVIFSFFLFVVPLTRFDEK